MTKAEIASGEQRVKDRGEIDKMVTAQAPGILWLWDKQPNLESSDVSGVLSESNATWDFTFTSMK